MLWMLFGCAVGLGIALLIHALRKSDVRLRWYEWLLVGVGLVLILFNVDTFIGSRAELEPKAANLSMLFLGFPGLVLAVLGLRLGFARKNSQSKGSQATKAAS